MGWTYTHRPKGQSALDFFRQEFGDGVIDAAATLTEAYIAYQVRDPKTGEIKGVICIVCLTQWVRGDYYNFGYKDMDESMGPGPARCPERILRQLTDYDFGSEEANRASREWREACWEWVSRRKSRPRLRRGMVIRFHEPIGFPSGRQIREFVVVQANPLRLVDARRPNSGRYYRLRRSTINWVPFDVVGKATWDPSRQMWQVVYFPKLG